MRSSRVSRRFRLLVIGAAVTVTGCLLALVATSASAGTTARVGSTAPASNIDPANNSAFTRSATKVSLRVSPPIIAHGRTAVLSVRVTGKGNTPTGKVTFADAEGTLCAVKLAKGAASCRRAFTAVGTYRITARYGGDAAHAGSSASAKLIVAQGETTTKVSVSAAAAPAGAPTTFTAKITASGGEPTGSVVFAIGASELCAGTLTRGTATCTVTYPTPGQYTVTATYPGDKSFYGSFGQLSWAVVPAVSSVQACVNVGTLGKNASVGVTLTLVTPGGSSIAQNVGSGGIWFPGGSNCPGNFFRNQAWTLTFPHPIAASALTGAASYLQVASTAQAAWHGQFELFTGAGPTLKQILLTRPNMYYNQKSTADPCRYDESVNTYRFPPTTSAPGTCGTPTSLNG